MYNDRTRAEQLAIVAALVSIIISRKLTPDEMGLVGDFFEILGDILDAMQDQIQYSEQRREKFKKNLKKKDKQ
ncbi:MULTISPECIES: hypothetical protein [Clostridium]|uniref:Uncharacterized protein n=1 Tax=Clostridium novyi (strain NT) TaxID=386415 RepID=A0Q3C8_CLONN|nr:MULTISPECIES: hypothetical protein [Clostridium]ABK61958.1 hypothetical protein NT01CX_0664 [Clostridium novyi NT]KEH86753.1 hypothetical protein Z967_05305 [Clostridium novyi A str. 4540]KEH87586.1 hypothetical protein Z966_11090 [Clostridium novyi A str. NCTC 538]KEH92607.1 hypothetical protein Z963_05125 [Clostridium botulinum C/D str. It1]KEH92895.1 hypothetical protein Z964_04360 [Clostridium novyi A str. GD211209]